MKPIVKTCEKYMNNLNWTQADVDHAKRDLAPYDALPENHWDCLGKKGKENNLRETEHLRNCINFWQNRIDNETK